MRNNHSNPDKSEFDNTTKKLDTLLSIKTIKIIISNGIEKDQEESLKL